MALYCLISAGGSPGVTTTSLALALTWPHEVVLAECDPAGHSVLAGYMAERLDRPPGPGLVELAEEVARSSNDVALGDFVIPLGGDSKAALLPGIRDPRHVHYLTPVWQPLTENAFKAAECDVIADVGRVGGAETPVALLAEADLVVMVLQRSLAQVEAAQPRLQALLNVLTSRGVPVMLCLVNSHFYSTPVVREALFGLPVIGELPYIPGDARVLSDGAPPRLTFRSSLLMRAGDRLGQGMRTAVAERTFRPSYLNTPRPPSFGGGR